MSDIFTILKHLYTDRTAVWINSIPEEHIQPFVIQRWLCMNDMIRVQTRWLDKYTFYLPPRMYLSLAWSIIPKVQRAPFIKYIKQQAEDEEYEFILTKVRKHFDLSDNDFRTTKDKIIKAIKQDKVFWFSFYGVPKQHWKKHYLNFNQIKEFGGKQEKPVVGLDAWGL